MKTFIKYLITSIVGLLFALAIMLAKSIFSQTDLKTIFHILTDSFFAPGMVFMCLGLLIFASNSGAFDMLSYGVKKMISLFNKAYSERLAGDFVEYKAERENKKIAWLFLVIIGACLVGISLIFLSFWYKYR